MATRKPLNNAVLQSDLDAAGFNIFNLGENDGLAAPTTFLGLHDCPSAYTGQAGAQVIVSPDETGLIFQPSTVSAVMADVTVASDAASVTLPASGSFPSGFNHLRLLGFVKQSGTGYVYVVAALNGDTTSSNYRNTVVTNDPAASAPAITQVTAAGSIVGTANGSDANGADFAFLDCFMPFYNSAVYKRAFARSSRYFSAPSAPIGTEIYSSRRGGNATQTMVLSCASGNILAGSRFIVVGSL